MSWQPLTQVGWILAAGGLVLTLLAAMTWAHPGERRLWLGRTTMAALLVGIALGPGFGSTSQDSRQRADVQVLVVLDRTVSMSASDGPNGLSRLEAAKADLRRLGGRLPRASFALLAWGRDARVVLPFTGDHETWFDAIDLLEREDPFEGVGSRTDRPLVTMRTLLRAAVDQHPDRDTVVVFVSDGENTAPGRPHSYAPLAELLDGGLVLGYGTEVGAPMPVSEANPTTLIDDQDLGATAISRRDPANLRRIAQQLEVTYVARNEAGAVDHLARTLLPPARTVGGEDVVAHELTWALALMVAVLAMLELRGPWRRWHDARRARWSR